MRTCWRETVRPPSRTPRSTSGPGEDARSSSCLPTRPASRGSGKRAPLLATSSAMAGLVLDLQNESGRGRLVCIEQVFDESAIDLAARRHLEPDVKDERLVRVLADFG